MMRRDNNAGNNNFHGPPYTPQQPTITFLAFPPKAHIQPRETQTNDLPQPLHPKNSDAFNNRHSHDVGPTQPNNAFIHLRNQISNLKSEFTRLIQKDPGNPSGQGEVRASFGVRRQDRLPTYSTMGFYNTAQTAEVTNESNRDPPSINFKNKTVGLEKTPLEIQIDKKRQIAKNEESNARLAKRYTNQFADKKSEQYLIPMNEPAQEHTKMQELEIQIRKLGELKHRAQEENLFLRRELTKRQTEHFQKIQMLTNDLDKTRIVIDQANISLSLKNSLVEKLQKQIQRHIQEIEICQKQTSSAQEQTLRLRQKYEIQIRNLQGIHSKNIDDIIEKYRAAEERIHLLGIEITQKDESLRSMQKNIQTIQQYENAKKESDILIEQLQKTNVHLQDQIKRLQSSLQQKQAKIETLVVNLQQAQKMNQQSSTSQLSQQILSRYKQIQEENTDLKKRVQSYKKTVEQLNNSNNSAREKQVVFKEQVKLLKEQNKKQKDEIKILAQQVHIKQSLITSLYRDISILDNEIRVSTHLKNMLAQFSRYIDELNGRILSLQSEKLNAKYTE